MGSNGFSALCKHCYFSSTGSKPLRRTAHLDGIRGLGAWSVVNYTLSAFEPFVNYGYGLTPEDGHRGPADELGSHGGSDAGLPPIYCSCIINVLFSLVFFGIQTTI